ncbi:hypothetical protein BsWGS_25759 [Bradybaena similaris]
MDEINKQGLYIWLRSVVESGRCPGVSWINEINGVFQIPWSNQKSRTWQKEDSSVFLEYAKHTGKFKPGDKMDFPKWKQNLKSAINKNRYIERLRVRDNLMGPKPYRVYRFLNEKTERKKSNDDFPDDINNEAVDFLSHSYFPGGLAVNNEAPLVQRDTSASGLVPIFSDNESRSSGSSPLSATAVQSHFRLSPDISRSDSCDHDQPQGNIPSFVKSYCEPMSDNFGDDSLSSSLPESISAHASLVTPSNIGVVTGNEINKHGDRSEKNVNETLHENDNQGLYPSNVLISTTIQEHRWSEILSNSMAANSHLTVKFTDLSQGSVCTKITHDNTNWAPQANSQRFIYPVTIQQSASSFTKDHHLNLSSHVALGAGFVLPMVDLMGVSQDCQHELNMKTHQAEQESKCRINSSRDMSMDHEFPTTSIPELEKISTECSSDLPSSMDTDDVNDNHAFSSAQFTTPRICQMPETAPKETSISPTMTSITKDSVMHIQVMYGTPHRTVKKFILTSRRSSCRLFYGAVNCPFMQRAIQGQQDAEEVELPPVDDPGSARYDGDMKIAIGKLLNDMELGIVISYSNNNIFVERRCRPRVFLSDGVSKSESLPRSTKKRPDLTTLAFDYNKHFKESIELSKTNNGALPLPKDHFFLTIGYEILANDESPTRKVPVYIVVRHVKAAQERFNILGASTIAPNPMCSDPDSFDKNVQLFKELDLKK